MLLNFEPASRGPALGFAYFRAGGAVLKATVLRDRRGKLFLSPYRRRGEVAASWEFADRQTHEHLLQELAPHLAAHLVAAHRDEDRARAAAAVAWIEREIFGRAAPSVAAPQVASD